MCKQGSGPVWYFQNHTFQVANNTINLYDGTEMY